MSGRKHHYLPKLLQRPFSHKRNGKGEFVHVFKKDQDYTVNLGGAGAERDFYGDQTDTQLDDEITRGETELAGILQAINSDFEGTDPEGCAQLMAALSMRTKAMRDALTSMMPVMLEGVRHKLGNEKALIEDTRRQIMEPAYFRRQFERVYRGQIPTNRDQRAKFLEAAKTKMLFEYRRKEADFGREAKIFIDSMLSVLAKKVDEIGHRSFQDALRRDPHMPKRVEWMKEMSFSVLDAPTGSAFILGDCAVIGYYSDGEFRLPLANVNDEVRLLAMLMPCSPTRCLIAKREGVATSFSVDQVNLQVASLSGEFFISSNSEMSDVAGCVDALGGKSPYLSNAYILDMMTK